MVWTDPAAVLALTGETVTEQTCAIASAMIETVADFYSDEPETASTARDRRYAGRAAAWQAPWVRDHPGLLTERENATSVSADSTNVQRESAMDGMLAPMAKRELMNLSWVRTHTVRLRDDRVRRLPDRLDFLNERSDPYWPGHSI